MSDPPSEDIIGKEAAGELLEVSAGQLDAMIAEGMVVAVDDLQPPRFHRAQVLALREAGG